MSNEISSKKSLSSKVIDNKNPVNGNYEHVINELNKVSKSMCLVKWNQATIHLHQGVTHSCHHNPVHVIPFRGIEDNPQKLHNTPRKIEHRKMMLSGDRPKECNYCWRVEDSGNPISDRILKSSYEESWPYANQILKSGLGENYSLQNLEISFSNTCQFKCSYCSANFSSKWQTEIETYGKYLFGDNHLKYPILPEENNPYVNAFWKWWTQIRNDLKVFRITGGEPLLSPNTFRLLKEIEENPLPGLNLAVNTNFGIEGKPTEDFIKHVKNITNNNLTKQFTVFTSIDSFGPQAEYIRHGLNLKIFTNNIEKLLLEAPKARLSFMITFNALSPFHFHDFLDYFEKLKEKHLNDESLFRLGIDINFLRDPIQLSLPVLGGKTYELCKSIVQRIESNPQGKVGQRIDQGYTYNEIQKARHLLTESQKKWSWWYNRMMKKRFLIFFKEHDRRRGTDLFKTFPDLKKIL